MTWSNDISETGKKPPSEWDQIYLADKLCPGIAKVRVVMPDDLDVQKAKGAKRSTVKDNGDKLVTVSISLELLPSEFEAFAFQVLPTLRPRSKSGGRDPVTVYHPATFAASVDRLIIRPITLNPPESGGTMKVQIEALEWTEAPAPVKTTGKTSGKNDAEKTKKEAEQNANAPMDALDNAIANFKSLF